MTALFLIGLGGFVGSVLRYLVGLGVGRLLPASALPYGTLCANTLGCFCIGLLGGIADTRAAWSPQLRGLVFVGLLGGFTTYSSFAYETLNLARDVSPLPALANIAAQLILGLGAVYLGHLCSRLA